MTFRKCLFDCKQKLQRSIFVRGKELTVIKAVFTAVAVLALAEGAKAQSLSLLQPF